MFMLFSTSVSSSTYQLIFTIFFPQRNKRTKRNFQDSCALKHAHANAHTKQLQDSYTLL